jgi:hypothetical protein
VTGEPVTGNELTRNLNAALIGRGPIGLSQLGNIGAEAATAGRVQRNYNARAAARRAEEGLSPAESAEVRRRIAEAAAEGGMKRGGMAKAKAKTKPKKMASGGMTSASKRGDGIATKGKTKCKMY